MTPLHYNWTIKGHNRQLLTLEREIKEKALSHAYLFAGPESIGKFTIAKKMAHIVQCEQGFCRNCHVCREIEKGYHPDTLEMADNQESIKIESIREILVKLQLTKQSPYKILLLQNIERMTPESANALLKTLEDPPNNVLFLFTTNHFQEVLPTLISRLRVCHFDRLSDLELLSLLRELYPLAEEQELKNFASFAFGSPGKAISFMENEDIFHAYKAMYDDICLFLEKKDVAHQFSYVGELLKNAKDGRNSVLVRDFLELLLLALRKKLLDGIQQSPEKSLKPKNNLSKNIYLLEETLKAQEYVKKNVNMRLLLENLLLHA